MSLRFTVIEMALNRADFRWKFLRLLRYSFVLGIVLCLVCLGFGALILKGWVTSKRVGIVFFAMAGLVGLGLWVVLAISVFAQSLNRTRLGAAVEREDSRLLDRLNTLLFLEGRGTNPGAEAFARRIAKQTQLMAAAKPLATPFAALRPIGWFLGFVAMLAITFLLYRTYSPLSRLVPDPPRNQAEKQPSSTLASQLELPVTNNLEQNPDWGEVRITEPGQDLKVTRLAVVPLRIEASANQSLKEVSWFAAINDGESTEHRLAPPREPRFAVYPATLDLGDMPLNNWDVISYYAKATTESSNSHVSQVYFIEVRPFREELMSLPGGANGKAYQFLKAISGLISGQEQVIRETHQAQSEPDRLEKTDQQNLAEMERELGDSVRSLQAEMQADPEAAVSADSLANLDKAAQSLDGAAKLLQRKALAEAEQRELGALAELTAARREFQRAIDQNPKAFEQVENNGNDLGSSNRLNQIAEFRNESKAGEDFVRRALEQQRNLDHAAQIKPTTSYRALGAEEHQLTQALKDFQRQHPGAFKETPEKLATADEAMDKATEQLMAQRPESPTATGEAKQKLDELSQAMKERAADQQLADSYKLKQMLEQQMQSLGQCANPAASGLSSQLRQTAHETRETVNQLRKMAEEELTRNAFGDPLREALGGQSRVNLDATLSRLQQPLDEVSQKQEAAAAKDALSKIVQAFDRSEPRALQAARKQDGLQPSPKDRLTQGMTDLNSLIKQLEKGKLSPEDQSQQGREALYGLQNGLRNRPGNNENAKQIQAELDRLMKTEPLDLGDLKKLMEALQMFSVENFEPSQQPERADVSNIDPTKMPPTYRARIQKYFQKLSEQPQ